MRVHIARDGKELGTFSLEEINRQLAAGALSLSDNAWYEGAAGWAPLSSVPGVAINPAPSAAAPVSSAAAMPAAASAQMSPAGPVSPVPAVIATPNEPLAIWSLVLSLLGLPSFLCCLGGALGVPLGIAGVICGHLALSKMKTQPALQGRGMALAGLIIGYISIGWSLFWTIFFGGLTAIRGLLEH